MIEQITVNSATCDGCHKTRLGHNDFEDIPGFYGTITEVADHSHGRQAKWYACRARCIGKAAYNVVVAADAVDGQGELQPLALKAETLTRDAKAERA